MSWLLFMDEPSPEPTALPYEVRGGVAIHASRLWEFVLDLESRELAAFGSGLRPFHKGLTGDELLSRDRFTSAFQAELMPATERRKHCRAFLAKSLDAKEPTRTESAAFAQACLEVAMGIFESLQHHDARLFAAVVPTEREKDSPLPSEQEGHLPKGYAFLLERFFYLLESEDEHGLIVMNEATKSGDRQFLAQIQSNFRKTSVGRQRASRITPLPLFGASELSLPLQAAALAMYCINWGFRLPGRGMTREVRPEIAERFGSRIGQLQYHGHGRRDGASFETYGIVFLPDSSAIRQQPASD
jgi:hypothetical protein